MTSSNIEISERKSGTGGLATIHIPGIAIWPSEARITIEPLDRVMVGNLGREWPERDIEPLSVVQVRGGFDLLVGPDIVDAAALAPGTPVVLSISDVGVRAELKWPKLTPSRYRRHSPVAMSATQLALELSRRNTEKLLRANYETANRGQDALSQDAMTVPSEVGSVDESSREGRGPYGSPTSRRQSLQTFAQGFATAALVALASWGGVNLLETTRPDPQQTTAIAQTAVALPPEFFDVDPASPRQKLSAQVKPSDALRFANFSLRSSPDGRDTDEGAYWLRHALSPMLKDPQLKWALTQLGSTFAAPSGGKADFIRARQLWEVAGLLGDGVALCFLGRLYEHGLGVPKSTETARAYFQHTATAGDCPAK
ncbi:MAG: tetratricopeptide repeat protein [Hyphomicrobiaceae bacterium]